MERQVITPNNRPTTVTSYCCCSNPVWKECRAVVNSAERTVYHIEDPSANQNRLGLLRDGDSRRKVKDRVRIEGDQKNTEC